VGRGRVVRVLLAELAARDTARDAEQRERLAAAAARSAPHATPSLSAQTTSARGFVGGSRSDTGASPRARPRRASPAAAVRSAPPAGRAPARADGDTRIVAPGSQSAFRIAPRSRPRTRNRGAQTSSYAGRSSTAKMPRRRPGRRAAIVSTSPAAHASMSSPRVRGRGLSGSGSSTETDCRARTRRS
jgi:hypothetical protein